MILVGHIDLAMEVVRMSVTLLKRRSPTAQPSVPTPDIGTLFSQHFTASLAATTDERNEVFRLRHQVYCEELGYESLRADSLESDAYDERALHGIIRHRKTGVIAGCARLIMPTPEGAGGFPFQQTCASTLWNNGLHPERLPYGSYGEVSRLAVSARFRLRAGDRSPEAATGLPNHTYLVRENEARVFPMISVGLFYLLGVLFVERHLSGVYIIAEPRLIRLLSRYGVEFTQISDFVEHRGTRAAYFLSRPTFLAGIPTHLYSLHACLQEAVKLG